MEPLPVRSVEVRFYDRNLELTDQPEKAFEGDAETVLSRFIATYRFALSSKFLVLRPAAVVIHFFNPVALLDHIDYIAQTLPRPSQQESASFRELSESKKDFLITVLQLVVLGGGIAGIEGGKLQAVWSSASFKNELGYFKPAGEIEQVVRERLRVQLAAIFCEDKRLHA